jgi:hypothetical protein
LIGPGPTRALMLPTIRPVQSATACCPVQSLSYLLLFHFVEHPLAPSRLHEAPVCPILNLRHRTRGGRSNRGPGSLFGWLVLICSERKVLLAGCLTSQWRGSVCGEIRAVGGIFVGLSPRTHGRTVGGSELYLLTLVTGAN